MDAQKVDLFVMTNQKYFPAEKIVYLKDKLLQTDIFRFQFFLLSLKSCFPDRHWSFQKNPDLLEPKSQQLIKPYEPDAFPFRFSIQ